MCSVRLVLVQTFALGAAKRETQRLLHLFPSIEAGCPPYEGNANDS